MSSTTSYRLSGIALLIGTALSIVYNICQAFLNGNDLATITSPLSLWSSVIGFIGSVLVLLGLPGVYTPFRGRFLESRQTSKEKRGNRRGEDTSCW
jgi:hypothetical protein